MVAKPKLRKRINNFPTTVRNFFFRQAVQGKNYLEGIWWNDLKTDPIKTIAITMIIVVALPLLAWEIAKLAIASTIATIGITGVAAIVAMGVAFSRFGSDIMHSVKNLFSSPKKTPNIEMTKDPKLAEEGYKIVETGKAQAGKVKNPAKSVVGLAQFSAAEQNKLKIKAYVLQNYYAIFYKYEINEALIKKIQTELQNQGISPHDLKTQLQAIQREIIAETDRAIEETTRELWRAQTLPYYEVENPTFWQRTAIVLVQFGQWCKSFVVAISTSEEIFRQTYPDKFDALKMARGEFEIPVTKREFKWSFEQKKAMYANCTQEEREKLWQEEIFLKGLTDEQKRELKNPVHNSTPSESSTEELKSQGRGEIVETKPSAPREVVLPATMQEEQDLATKSNLTYRSAARKDIFDVLRLNKLFDEVLPNQQMLEAAQQQVTNHGQKLNDYLQELQQEHQRLQQELGNVQKQQGIAEEKQKECTQKIKDLEEKNQQTADRLQQEPKKSNYGDGPLQDVVYKGYEEKRKKATRDNAPRKVGIQKARDEISKAQKRQEEFAKQAAQMQTAAKVIEEHIATNLQAGQEIYALINKNSHVSEVDPTVPPPKYVDKPPEYSEKDSQNHTPGTISYSTTGGPAHPASHAHRPPSINN